MTVDEVARGLGDLQNRIQTLEVQISMMNPVEMLQFKATVLEALKTIDKDIEQWTTQLQKYDDKKMADIKEVNECHEKFRKRVYEKLEENGRSITTLKSKVTAWAVTGAAFINFAFWAVKEYLDK